MTISKIVDRSLEEIEKLKLKIKELENERSGENKPTTWSMPTRSRVDQICEGRNEAMERMSIKLFGGKNAKQIKK